MMAVKRRNLVMWFCSFALAASVLVVYFGVPWLPICGGGILALVWTLVKGWRS